MPNHPLFYPLADRIGSANFRDQVQIALAIADPSMLTALLVNAIPPLIEHWHIASITAEIGVPVDNGQSADGIVSFETVQCVLANSYQPCEPLQQHKGGWNRENRELVRLTQHESEMQTLGQNLSLAPLVSLLSASGFTPKQIEEILRLPTDGWHKTWWYAIDVHGNFTIPFLRHIRTLRYPDGTFTIQYKDFFEQDKPPCFTKQSHRALVTIKPDHQGFGETLRQLNYQRTALGIRQSILICNTISELEAQAFINQAVSLYPAIEVTLPTLANCGACGRRECPMNGVEASPVALCLGFLPESEFA